MTDIAAKEAGEEVLIILEVTLAGGIKVRKAAAIKTSAPKDAGELRAKYSLLVHAWLFARTRFTSREWIADLKVDFFVPLAEYILGAKCASLKSAELGTAGVRITPERSILMKYEYETRKLMYELVKEDGWAMTDALAKAMKDDERRSLYYSPLSTSRWRSSSTTRTALILLDLLDTALFRTARCPGCAAMVRTNRRAKGKATSGERNHQAKAKEITLRTK